MRKVRIPAAVLKRHKDAFEQYIEDGLARLLSVFCRNRAYCEYIKCLMIDRTDIVKRKSIAVRNVKALASVVNAVELLKAKYGATKWSVLENKLRSLFDYAYRFVKGNNSTRWDTYQYIQAMIQNGLRYCPYCNCHQLEAYKTSDGKEHKGPLDHFYDKARYPYLALSIYNLIPVCDRCNHEKLSAPVSLNTHSHPFADDFHGLVEFSASGEPLDVLFPAQRKCTVALRSKQKKRSLAALKLAQDVELINRYNAEDGGLIAHDILTKGERYRIWTIRDYLSLAKFKRITVSEVYEEEFGVKPDGADINIRQYGKLRYDLMPQSVKR